jgi:hypothetical protein
MKIQAIIVAPFISKPSDIQSTLCSANMSDLALSPGQGEHAYDYAFRLFGTVGDMGIYPNSLLLVVCEAAKNADIKCIIKQVKNVLEVGNELQLATRAKVEVNKVAVDNGLILFITAPCTYDDYSVRVGTHEDLQNLCAKDLEEIKNSILEILEEEDIGGELMDGEVSPCAANGLLLKP